RAGANDLVDLPGGSPQRLAHFLDRFLVTENQGRAAVGRLRDFSDRAVQVHDGVAEECGAELADPLEDVIDRGLVLGEVRATLLRDRVDLLPALLDLYSGVAQVFEERQSRVYGSGAGGVHATEPLLERLDDLVPVSGFLLEQLQDHVLSG